MNEDTLNKQKKTKKQKNKTTIITDIILDNRDMHDNLKSNENLKCTTHKFTKFIYFFIN